MFSYSLFLCCCQVTLFGESAGSASVGLHLLSPGSHGLFNRAILQSGSPNTPWAVITQQQAWNRSLSLGRLLGCPLAPLAVLEQCLQRAHPEDIIKQQYSVLSLPTLLALPFPPSVDHNFLPDMPEVCMNLWLLVLGPKALNKQAVESRIYLQCIMS